MAAPKLRAVTSDDAPVVPLTVEEAAESGDHRALLVAMRERIARTVSDERCPPRDLAALTRRLQDIAREIEEIESRSGGDDIGHAAGTPDDEFRPEAL